MCQYMSAHIVLPKPPCLKLNNPHPMSTKPYPSASGTASGTASGSKSSSPARLADTKLCHGTMRDALAVSLSDSKGSTDPSELPSPELWTMVMRV